MIDDCGVVVHVVIVCVLLFDVCVLCSVFGMLACDSWLLLLVCVYVVDVVLLGVCCWCCV